MTASILTMKKSYCPKADLLIETSHSLNAIYQQSSCKHIFLPDNRQETIRESKPRSNYLIGVNVLNKKASNAD